MKYSKTVYSLIYPESKQILSTLWTEQPLFLYEKAYEGTQDKYHGEFLETWKQWSKPVLDIKWEGFGYSYPTAGSTEGIRETIVTFANECHQKGIPPVMHVFTGEYEGYEAQAKGYGVTVVKHDRTHWQNSIDLVKEHNYFFLSQPSSIDGNVWPEYDLFMTTLSKTVGVKVFVDLCYIGCVAKDFKVNLNYDIIERFCFSLSKVFGVYYHRIGGIFSKSSMPGLYGNIWFKNLFSLHLGTNLLKNFSVFELPRKYQHLQLEALKNFEPQWQASDVIILSFGKNLPESYKEYNRGPNYRVCLTPEMDEYLCKK